MRIRKENITEDIAYDTAKMCDAFASPARIAIFRYILKKNAELVIVRNKDLVEAFSYSQATISQHMNKLTTGGLITSRKQGTSTCYYANVGNIGKLVALLNALGK